MKNRVSTIIDAIKKLAVSQPVSVFALSTLLAIIALNTELYRVEAYFYDLRMRWKGTESPHSDLMLLALNDSEDRQETTVYSIENHAKLLEALLKHRPRAIIYLNKFDPIEAESKLAASERFLELARKAQASGTKLYFGTDVDLGGEVLPPYPLSILPHYPSVLHRDGTMFGEDKVMRRGLLTVFQEPSLHLRVAFPDLNREALLEKARNLHGAYYYAPAESWHIMIRYPGNTAVGKNVFPMLHLSDALAGKSLEGVHDKILLIDTMQREAMNDYAYTPYSRTIYTHPRLFVHAAILDTLLKDDGLAPVPAKIDAALTFLLALILAFITITMHPLRGVTALFLLSSGLFVVSLVFFRLGYWLPLVHPLLAMFLTYYMVVPYRAIQEYKKRWEVQEKHDLLVQVEEMKGNFLSLMSHDLKTPVARIQGLAEMVLRQGGLLPQQEVELQHILQSTESLDKFISKILHLTKVESNEIKLNKRSKDINKIIEQCANKLQFQAQQKDVALDLSLEPLFPIHVDPALLIQVFTNIIDNAIKYSKPGTRIKICSREEGEFVKIMVEDTGPGLDEEEKRQLFTKFFRGKSQHEEQIKGSGLGLYLAKYFIELHKGKVEAISQKGEGSRFLIQLPIYNDSI